MRVRLRQLSAIGTPGLVTVVVPCLNYGRYLPRALDSVMRQSYANWECIVSDDGSTDDTASVVASYARRDTRIRYIFQRNRGLSAARNRALLASQGTYIQFLDADDLIESRKLESHVRYLEEHDDVGVVYSPARYFRTGNEEDRRYSMGEPDVPWMPETSGVGPSLVSALSRTNIMAVNCALVRRSVVARVGLFDERLRALEDWDYWMRCAAAGVRFQYVDSGGTYALVRLHALSMTNDKERMTRALVQIHRRIARTAPGSRVQMTRLADTVKTLSVIQATTRKPISGLLTALYAGVGLGQGRFALKYLVCFLLMPLIGSERFADFLFDIPLRNVIAGAFFNRKVKD